MWQKCPICNGSGNVLSGFGSLQTKICTVCNGKKIINELTGLPPTGIAIKEIAAEKDFRDANMESQQEYFGK